MQEDGVLMLSYLGQEGGVAVYMTAPGSLRLDHCRFLFDGEGVRYEYEVEQQDTTVSVGNHNGLYRVATNDGPSNSRCLEQELAFIVGGIVTVDGGLEGSMNVAIRSCQFRHSQMYSLVRGL